MYVHNSVNNTPHNYDDEDINDPAVTLISKQHLSHPLHLHSNDFVALTVVSVKLKGIENYQVWSCVMLLAIKGKNKTGFIDGSCRRSNTDELNALWKQFDALVELPRCTCHAADGFKKHNQLMKLMQFLMGLDDTYMQIRSSILSRETLSDVRSAYAIISNEESHRIASGNITETSQRSQTFASLLIPNDNGNRRTAGGSNLVCENGGFNGHTIDRCFKITGYPPDFGKKKVGQNFKGKNVSNNVVGSSSSSGFFDE
ncbi:ribonuclease H-like domain-containing protein [Tanacetum coccineum]